MKKYISVLLSLFLIAGIFCSCGKKEDIPNEDSVEKTFDGYDAELKLAYSKSDSLNPFETETVINTQISALVYDGLFRLDASYNPQPVIAKNAICSGEHINVTLDDVLFSNGAPVTVNDIIYSFNLAKASQAYSARLENFRNAVVSSDNMLMFNLDEFDPYAVSCLDFPVVKADSDDVFPVGSGRYMFANKGDSVYLVLNSQKRGFSPKIRTIKLEAIHESSSIESSLVIGTTAFSYDDLSDGTYSRINAQSVEMGINSFVYLGINSNSDYFSNSLIRKAVNISVDRAEAVSASFQSHAREAYTAFNPDWYVLNSQNLTFKRDVQQAKELIEESELNIKERQITLLVCNENEFKSELGRLVKSCLEEIGFSVNYKNYSREAFMYDLEAGGYDIYIGEVRLPGNMNLNPLFTGTASFGISEDNVSALRYADFLAGNCELMDFLNTFNEDIPFIPVCYRNAIVSYTNAIECDFSCCDGDVYCDIESWSLK